MPGTTNKTRTTTGKSSLRMVGAAIGTLAVIAILAVVIAHGRAGNSAVVLAPPGRVLVRTPDSASCATYSFDNHTAQMKGGDETYCYDDLWHGKAEDEPMQAWRKSFRRE